MKKIVLVLNFHRNFITMAMVLISIFKYEDSVDNPKRSANN